MSSRTVCLCANTLYYPEGGGHLWVYLNWALGLQSNNCQLVWLELVDPKTPSDELHGKVSALLTRLKPYGISGHIALTSWTDEPLPPNITRGYLDIEDAASADLLLNIQYDLQPQNVSLFRRSVFLDIDPGLLQFWIDKGQVVLAPHDWYFTIGETVGRPGSRFPTVGLQWQYTPPCVSLDWWQPSKAENEAPFTTVVHWWASSCVEDDTLPDEKRHGFLPYLDLPKSVSQPLELAVDLGANDEAQVISEKQMLKDHGWRLQDPRLVAATPWQYTQYIQKSRAEFSCAKPSCIRLQNAWISDRTLCYLASGKPAVVEHTGPSRFLPDAAGLFRFRNKTEAVRHIETVVTDYERQCHLARALAEEYFDARKVVQRVLEQVLS